MQLRTANANHGAVWDGAQQHNQLKDDEGMDELTKKKTKTTKPTFKKKECRQRHRDHVTNDDDNDDDDNDDDAHDDDTVPADGGKGGRTNGRTKTDNDAAGRWPLADDNERTVTQTQTNERTNKRTNDDDDDNDSLFTTYYLLTSPICPLTHSLTHPLIDIAAPLVSRSMSVIIVIYLRIEF